MESTTTTTPARRNIMHRNLPACCNDSINAVPSDSIISGIKIPCPTCLQSVVYQLATGWRRYVPEGVGELREFAEPQHTELPWAVTNEFEGIVPASIVRANGLGGTIADVFGDSMAEAKANAELIVKAVNRNAPAPPTEAQTTARLDYHVADNAEVPAVLLTDADGNTLAVLPYSDASQELAVRIVRATSRDHAFDALVEATKNAIAYIEETGNYSDDSDCRAISDELMAALRLAGE